MDGPRGCHEEGSKSKREKQVSYNNAYMCNLENGTDGTCLQSRKRYTDAENKCMDQGSIRGGGREG